MLKVACLFTAIVCMCLAWMPQVQKLNAGSHKMAKSTFETNENKSMKSLPMALSSIARNRMIDVLRSTRIAVGVFSASQTAALATVTAQSDTKAKKTKKPRVLETPDMGIKYIELIKGSGPFPVPGDFVVISYTGFLHNGTVFDSTEVKGRKPLSFRFGQKQVIPGLESVIAEMQPGGQVTCNIPTQYAYGAKGVCLEGQGEGGVECLIPPNEDLKYAVKLISLGAGYN